MPQADRSLALALGSSLHRPEGDPCRDEAPYSLFDKGTRIKAHESGPPGELHTLLITPDGYPFQDLCCSRMRTLDTNVILRLLVGDDPQQMPIAKRAFLEAIATGGVDLPDVVLMEVAAVAFALGRVAALKLQLRQKPLKVVEQQ